MARSKFFSNRSPVLAHLLVGQGGLAGEIADLSSDIDDALVSLELSLFNRVVDIEFAFDGADYVPGSYEGKLGICYTSGGVYVAGAIYRETEGAAVPLYMYQGLMACPRMDVSGVDVTMAADGIYLAQSATAPYLWCSKGGGGSGPVLTGVPRVIALPFNFTHLGTTKSTATSIPAGARVLETVIVVPAPFTGGIAPTCELRVHGPAGDVTLQTLADINLGLPDPPNVFQNTAAMTIPAGRGGPVQVVLGGTATAGSAEVYVTYVQPQL
jgi:hypothetical protein